MEHLALAMGVLLRLAVLTTFLTTIFVPTRPVAEAINFLLQMLVFPGQLLDYDDEFLVGHH